MKNFKDIIFNPEELLKVIENPLDSYIYEDYDDYAHLLTDKNGKQSFLKDILTNENINKKNKIKLIELYITFKILQKYMNDFKNFKCEIKISEDDKKLCKFKCENIEQMKKEINDEYILKKLDKAEGICKFLQDYKNSKNKNDIIQQFIKNKKCKIQSDPSDPDEFDNIIY